MNDLSNQTIERINALIAHTKANAGCLHQLAELALLNREMDKRAKAQKQSLEHDSPSRERSANG